ncbi:c-type cytochrome [Aminobacter sp. HY435]|uniref:c-type cytochrome n=1 Tax=Aminobacter sp. HY435 TaxID=2970917 RepID=UPI0022B9C6F3|nr:c-type cytochrome [Aminobacter sp. HY435]
MKSTACSAAVLLAASFLATATAHAAGDAAAGKKVFAKCMACHEAATDKNKIGPSLHGVMGRTAGTLASFEAKYSDAMKAAGAGGLVWDEANFAAYVKAPKEKIPGNKMAFPGLKDDADIANVIAYLEEVAKQ